MPAMTIRNISDAGHEALKQRARLHGTSAEAEVRAMVDGLAERKQAEVGFGTQLQAIFRNHGVSLPEYTRDKSPSEPAVFE